MNVRTKLTTLLMALVTFSCAQSVSAVVVTIGGGGPDLLSVRFSTPVQHVAHNALNINTTSQTGPGAFSAQASLYDGSTLLSQSITNYVGERYATNGSIFASSDPLINY
jgi:hypothetical protein